MKVFISHSHETNDLARQVGEALKRKGWDVWHDDMILPGQNWAAEIARELNESEAMVVLLTPDALKSTTVRREIDFALTNKSFNRRLIPVLVGLDKQRASEEVPWIFRHLNVINLPAFGRREEGSKQITKALQAVA
jgi:TIR domain